MICYIPMCICATVATSLRTNADCIGPFYPRFYRKHEIVASCRIFNCTEFGTIKIGVIQHFPFAKIFDSAFKTKPTEDNMLLQLTFCHVCKADVVFFIVLDNANICILNGNFCHCIVIDAMSFDHKSRYNLRDYVFFNGLFAKMKYNNSIIGIVFPDNYFNSILERIIE